MLSVPKGRTFAALALFQWFLTARMGLMCREGHRRVQLFGKNMKSKFYR